MAYLLRCLILLMVVGIALSVATATGWIELPIGHITTAIAAFLYTIFAQAFVMFYFIGVSRLTQNVKNALDQGAFLETLFGKNPPEDLSPYRKKADKFFYDATLYKRQIIPWTMLMLVLGALGFLLGGAYDTGMVDRTVHTGVIYGFIAAMGIGTFRQWRNLGRGHILLRKLKAQFSLPDNAM